MAYKTYYFRAPDIQSIIDDLLAAADARDLDPIELGVLDTDDEGSAVLHESVWDATPAGRWYETPPTYDEEGNLTSEGTLGTYAIANLRSPDPVVQQVAESFGTADASLTPSEVPDAEKAAHGTSRITDPSTPVRRFATHPDD